MNIVEELEQMRKRMIGNINTEENLCYAMVNNNNRIVAIPYFDFSQFTTMYAALHESNATQLG